MSKVNLKRLNELLEKARENKKPKSPRNTKAKQVKGIHQANQMTASKRLSIHNLNH